jgi:RNA polymerase sigma-70 factor, ECF subfamily
MADISENTNSPDKEKLFKTLFESYFNILLLNANKYLLNFSESEEIVQDVFVKLWEQLPKLPKNTNYKAYLYTSVFNSCQNFIKHKKIIEKHRSAVLAEAYHTGNNGQDKELLNSISKAINQIPEKWRTTFMMNRFEGLKYREIAEKLDISEKTVEKYISRSLHFLREKFKNHKLNLLLIAFQFLWLLQKK